MRDKSKMMRVNDDFYCWLKDLRRDTGDQKITHLTKDLTIEIKRSGVESQIKRLMMRRYGLK